MTDEASSVGLGWSLNAGGRVSQIMAGKNDFDVYGYYNVYPKNPLGLVMGSVSGCLQLPWNKATYSGAFYNDWFTKLSDTGSTSTIYEGYDFQPDLF